MSTATHGYEDDEQQMSLQSRSAPDPNPPAKAPTPKEKTRQNLKRAKGKGGAYERISAAVLNHPNAPPGFKGGQKDVDELSRALGLQPGVDYRNWATLEKAILNALYSEQSPAKRMLQKMQDKGHLDL